jgi:hypothetical protein
MKKWMWVGIVLLLTGVALLAATLPLLGPEVIVRETMAYDRGYLTIDDLALEEGSYSVWIEDVYPGFDDPVNFDVWFEDENGGQPRSWIPGTYHTATFDGVRCELVEEMAIPGGVYYFEIEDFNWGGPQPTPDTQVFIVRYPPDWMEAILGVGITLVSLGAIIVALLNWPKKAKEVAEGYNGPSSSR